jgi:hypothetical protein
MTHRISFIPVSRWITWNDIERCPFAMHEPKWAEWSRKDDERLFFMALNRYANYLQGKYIPSSLD